MVVCRIFTTKRMLILTEGGDRRILAATGEGPDEAMQFIYIAYPALPWAGQVGFSEGHVVKWYSAPSAHTFIRPALLNRSTIPQYDQPQYYTAIRTAIRPALLNHNGLP